MRDTNTININIIFILFLGQVEVITPPHFTLYDANQYNEKRLYNIDRDPLEEVNLFDVRPDIVKRLMNQPGLKMVKIKT